MNHEHTMTMKKRIVASIIICLVIVVLILFGCYTSVFINALGRTCDKVEDIPPYEYGLLLGTSPFTAQGARNYYFENRIKSAAELYKAGKIKQIIVSGGDYTRTLGYDEPRAMTDSLVAHGVPFNAIVRDYEGTRTLRSIVKAKETYHLDSVILISQKYHNERAIAQADKYGLKAIGYNAPHSHIKRNRIKNVLREFPARVKLYFDLWFGEKPSFLFEAREVANNHYEDWYYDPSYPVPNHWTFRSVADKGYGFFKVISSDTPNWNGHLSYYNSRHGYYVLLPDGMGVNQRGENMMGAHDNEFYNADTTLVVSSSSLYYDVVLYDIPQYADSFVSYERDFLNKMGEHTIKRLSPYVWLSEGRIDHNNKNNPPADRFIRKWLLKKDIENRECHMSLTIYFNDSLEYRIPEFEKIINQFPNMPNL